MDIGARDGQGPHGEETNVLDQADKNLVEEQGNNEAKFQGASAKQVISKNSRVVEKISRSAPTRI